MRTIVWLVGPVAFLLLFTPDPASGQASRPDDAGKKTGKKMTTAAILKEAREVMGRANDAWDRFAKNPDDETAVATADTVQKEAKRLRQLREDLKAASKKAPRTAAEHKQLKQEVQTTRDAHKRFQSLMDRIQHQPFKGSQAARRKALPGFLAYSDAEAFFMDGLKTYVKP